MAMKRAETVAGTVEKWLGNPISRALLKFASGRTKHGDRLDLALRSYIGEDILDNLSLRTRLASLLVKFVIERGSKSFGIPKDKVKNSLDDDVIRRGIANVLEGIAHHGVKRPYTGIAPFLVVWNYTRRCNQYCKHCYEDAHPNASIDDELTTKEAKSVVDELVDAGVVAVAFSGGEPLMRRDIFEVASYAKERGLFVSIATNGTLMTKTIARKMAEVFDYAEISLDGFEETHDNFRAVKGSWKRTCEGIKNSIAEEIDTCVALTATHYNIGEIRDLIDFVEEDLGAEKIIVFNFIPVKRGKEIVEEDLTPNERMSLLRELYSRTVDEHCPMIFYSTAPQYSRVSLELSGGPAVSTHFTNEGAMEAMRGKAEALSEFIGGCGAGRLYCGLEPNGDVEPCVFIPITVGNIRNQSLREIWNPSEVLNDLRNRDKIEGCGNCDYSNVCGGCRARAYAYFGDLLAPDPGCPDNVEYWEKIQRGSY